MSESHDFNELTQFTASGSADKNRFTEPVYKIRVWPYPSSTFNFVTHEKYIKQTINGASNTKIKISST